MDYQSYTQPTPNLVAFAYLSPLPLCLPPFCFVFSLCVPFFLSSALFLSSLACIIPYLPLITSSCLLLYPLRVSLLGKLGFGSTWFCSPKHDMHNVPTGLEEVDYIIDTSYDSKNVL